MFARQLRIYEGGQKVLNDGMIFAFKNRCTLGLRKSWKKKKFHVLGVEWTYETAMIAKAGL